eukprot:TRINITY_DN1549_c0_g3_i1.p1 TRINITY_DN1549_c0_g3~~TRINITY_DN1549_c0_g3_i1.p1  ORF type:complete len:292 (-),score=69.37 TRINITY_DN1549_c0_g3_i1:24-899(-)
MAAIRVVVERVDPRADDGRYNSSNHPRDPGDAEAAAQDYWTEVDRTRLSRYRGRVPTCCAFDSCHTFTAAERDTLLEASASGVLTGRPSSLFQPELTAIAARLDAALPHPGPPHGYFMRFDGASPKDGTHRFPVMDATEVVNQVATSKRAALGLTRGDCTLHFAPFDPEWNTERELRVFVCRGHVTCISQYMWQTRGLLSDLSDEELEALGGSVCGFVEQQVVAPLAGHLGTDSFTADLYWRGEQEFRVVELNSFGYWLACGSALFHWTHDRHLLYSSSTGQRTVYLRVFA